MAHQITSLIEVEYLHNRLDRSTCLGVNCDPTFFVGLYKLNSKRLFTFKFTPNNSASFCLKWLWLEFKGNLKKTSGIKNETFPRTNHQEIRPKSRRSTKIRYITFEEFYSLPVREFWRMSECCLTTPENGARKDLNNEFKLPIHIPLCSFMCHVKISWDIFLDTASSCRWKILTRINKILESLAFPLNRFPEFMNFLCFSPTLYWI